VNGCVRPDSEGQLEGASCTDPKATGRVVAIEADYDCYDVDGVESQESGSGVSGALCVSSGTGPPKATPNVAKPGDSSTIVLCLAPKGKDPASSPDTAKAGDCLARAGKSYTRVAWSAGNAEFRVLHRDDSTVISPEYACGSYRGTTMALSHKTDNLFGGYILCLGQA
jgi:hypothetical protein